LSTIKTDLFHLKFQILTACSSHNKPKL